MTGGGIARVLLAGDELREIEPVLAETGLDVYPVEAHATAAASGEIAPDIVVLGPGIAPGRAISLLESFGVSGSVSPVILIGPYDSSRREEAFAAGAADCISFPCGTVELAARIGRAVRDVSQRRDLARCAAEIAAAREQANRLTMELQAASQEFRRSAASDPLTGVANPRRFHEVLEQEWKRAQRSDGAVSLLLVDLDNFRLFNEAHGHAAGDDCLREVARALQGGLNRGGDFIARYGGEEFVVVVPGGDEAQAQALAGLLVRRVRELGIRNDGVPNGIVTVSIGVATIRPTAERSPANLLAAVDDGLRAAKSSGRDRVATGRVR